MKDYTVQILRALSDRLSGRADCNQIEYVVYMGLTPEGARNNEIIFHPYRIVYPNRFHRQPSDQIEVVSHILNTQFPEIRADETNSILDGTFTRGVYKYILSYDKRKRQWVRIK